MTPEELIVWAEEAKFWLGLASFLMFFSAFVIWRLYGKVAEGCDYCHHCINIRNLEIRKRNEERDKALHSLGLPTQKEFDEAARLRKAREAREEGPPGDEDPPA